MLNKIGWLIGFIFIFVLFCCSFSESSSFNDSRISTLEARLSDVESVLSDIEDALMLKGIFI